MFLTDEELQRLTGYQPNQRKRICRWLAKRGYPFLVNADGAPVVVRQALEDAMSPPEPKPKAPEPPPKKSNIEKWHEQCEARRKSPGPPIRIKPYDYPPKLAAMLEKSDANRLAAELAAEEVAEYETLPYHQYRRLATPNWLTAEQRQEMRRLYLTSRGTKGSRNPLSVDHIVPLRGANVCGLHVPWNLRLMPLRRNQRKNNLMDSEAC